ncbi:protein TTE1956-like [Paramacrobiotus metropolitanus]|uniref:protein TTE1956-like n=1 Tax=Paramacrobiotus metropolitanus TaxID=2943436 RepID=UPI0024464524|nr:protein TTE1956-like [Paramacrobiotus metropolitanus]
MINTHFFSVSFLCLPLLAQDVSGKVIGAFVVPHGGLALDPFYANITNATAKDLADQIHQSLIRVSREIGALSPDIIFLSTPHGISDLENFVFYLNKKARGLALAEDCTNITQCAYRLNVTVAVKESLQLVSHLKRSHNVSGISGFGPPGETPQAEPLPLGWGEVIPLYFVPNISSTKLMIFSHPSRRYNSTKSMMAELLHLGRSLYLRLQHSPERVAIVISSDLAHTHSKDGPYGYSDAAQPFDDAIGRYLTSLDPKELLETAGDLVEKALSCGFTGLVMLHAMLSEAGLKNWSSKLWINGHPTYYGMATATIVRMGTEAMG